MTRAPYPLQWPEGWKRTQPHQRQRSAFQPHFTLDRNTAIHWLDKRGSRVVITSDLPTRNDGLPYIAPVGDPGIAVWWVEKGNERVVACDRWLRAEENMRAITKTLEAMRGLDRWGANEMVERAFAGFAALPPGQSPSPTQPARRSWREIFGMTAFETLAPPDLLAIVRSRHRERIKLAHPDAGGSHEAASEINAALAAAEAELT